MPNIFHSLISCCSSPSALADVDHAAHQAAALHRPPSTAGGTPRVQASPRRIAQDAVQFAQARRRQDRAHFLTQGFSTEQFDRMVKEGGDSVVQFLCEQDNLHNLRHTFSSSELVSMACNEGAAKTLKFLAQSERLHQLMYSESGEPLLSSEKIVSLANNSNTAPILGWICQRDGMLETMSSMNCQKLTAVVPLLTLHPEWTEKNLEEIGSMYADRVEALGPLLTKYQDWTTKHFPSIISMFGDFRTLTSMLDLDKELVTGHLKKITSMNDYELKGMLPLMSRHHELTKRNFKEILSLECDHLYALVPLLDHHQDWSTNHFDEIMTMDGQRLDALIPLLNNHKEWTTIHFQSTIKSMNRGRLQALCPLLDKHQQWATEHVADIKQMKRNRLVSFTGMLDIATSWTHQHVRSLIALPEKTLQNLHGFFEADIQGAEKLNEQDLKDFHRGKGGDRAYFLEKLPTECIALACTTNPFVRKLLGTSHQWPATPKEFGASRSTLNPFHDFESPLTQAFEKNQEILPEATFGVEYEMFVDGMSPTQFPELAAVLRTKDYHYETDLSLIPTASVDNSVELVTPILRTKKDLQKLQSILARLNDMGASSNASSGVHIHVGFSQWKAERFFPAPGSVPSNVDLAIWDTPDAQDITSFQLRLMKQFFINLHSAQKEFYLVSRKSRHSKPNVPSTDDQSIEGFYKDITTAADMDALIHTVQPDGRHYNINLESFADHETIEIRGFTKKHSDAMAVDPNMPIRDIVFMQEVLIATLADAKEYVLSGAKPALDEQALPIQPAKGMRAITNRYTQDTFALEIIHALSQRKSGRRGMTMGLLVTDRKHIQAETIGRIRQDCEALLAADGEASHFMDALEEKASWPPVRRSRPSIARQRSLRSIPSAGLLLSPEQ